MVRQLSLLQCGALTSGKLRWCQPTPTYHDALIGTAAGSTLTPEMWVRKHTGHATPNPVATLMYKPASTTLSCVVGRLNL